ncbi:MAG: hypothetical protein H0W99_07290 [Acidobacteria bacterium]|nr:hypothetical protein [Acidobacteriota bacterium]
MDLAAIFSAVEKVIPILATVAGRPELGVLAQKLIDMGEEEITRRQGEGQLTRTQILQRARDAYAEAKRENEKLKNLGHEPVA